MKPACAFSRFLRSLAVIPLLLISTLPAGASAGDAAAGEAAAGQAPPTAVDVVRPPSQMSTPELESAALYRLGLYTMGQGQFAEARVLFQRVVRDYAGTPSAASAALRIAEIDQVKKLPPSEQATQARSLENSGRAEFVFSETFMGGYLGVTLPLLMSDDPDEKAVVAGGMVGLAAGLALSLQVSKYNPLTASQAGLIYYGQVFGAGNIVMLYLGAAYPNIDDGRPALGLSWLGIGAGTLAGALVGQRFQVPEGRVSLVASSGFWMAGITEMTMLTFLSGHLTQRAYFLAAPIAADVGIAASAYLAHTRDFRISRSRMRLINLGGLVGGLMGGGSAVLGEASDSRTYTGLILGGALVGLGASFVATRGWDHTYHPDLFTRRPVNSVLALEDGKIRLGSPSPILGWVPKPVTIATGEPARMVPHVSMSLFSGRW